MASIIIGGQIGEKFLNKYQFILLEEKHIQIYMGRLCAQYHFVLLDSDQILIISYNKMHPSFAFPPNITGRLAIKTVMQNDFFIENGYVVGVLIQRCSSVQLPRNVQ